MTKRPGRPCIYCGTPADGREHWIPRCLGRFKGYEPLKGVICRKCNERFSTLEDDFAHASPEAVFRERLGIRGRKGHRRVNPFYHRASAEQAVRIIVQPDASPYPYLAELRPGEPTGSPLRQVILQDGNGRFHPFPIPDERRAEVLAKQICNLGLQAAAVVAVFARNDEQLALRRFLTKVFSRRFRAIFHPLDGEGTVGQTKAHSIVGISRRYTQAIAKIAFHYALRVLGHVDGSAAEFDAVRRFITEGGDWQEFIEFPARQFVLPLAQGAVPRYWGHYFAVEARFQQPIVVRLQFFVGPDYLAPAWAVRIGVNPSRVAPDLALGHYAYYFDPPVPSHDGEIVPTGFAVELPAHLGHRRWGFRRG